MLKDDNVIIIPMEKDDFELFYLWMQDEKQLGNFVDMEMVYEVET